MAKGTLLKRATGIGVAVALASLPLLSGCTVMANQEQLAMLEDARKAADAAEAQLDACKQKQAELQRDLAKKKQTLSELKNTRDTVQKALNQ